MIVRTTSGDVQGAPITTGARFRGIPYAAAPEGELRFAAPVPAPAWDGVRDAREAGPTATQRHREIPGLDLTPLVGSPGPAGPDYLTVDVWTPDPEREKPPGAGVRARRRVHRRHRLRPGLRRHRRSPAPARCW